MKCSDEKILAALMCSSSVAEAARKAGVHRHTVSNRLKDPSFHKRYQAMQDERIRASVDRAKQLDEAAADVLLHYMQPRMGVTPSERLRAAEAALRHVRTVNERKGTQEPPQQL